MLAFARPTSLFAAPIARHYDPIDTLFSDLTSALARPTFSPRSSLMPSIEEHADHYSLQLATPGVRRELLQVSVVGEKKVEIALVNDVHSTPASASPTDDTLGSNATSTTAAQPLSPRALFTTALPSDADIANISSAYENGMLTITIPKRSTAEAEKPAAPTAALAALEDSVHEQAAKVKGLEAQLREERQALAAEHAKLRAAREEEARRTAALRRPLAIA